MVVVVTEGLIFLRLRRHKATIEGRGVTLPVPFIHLLLRGLIFTIYDFIVMGVMIGFSFFPALQDVSATTTISLTEVGYIGFSLSPVVAFLLFGTQRDVLRVWFLCSSCARSTGRRPKVPSFAKETIQIP